MNIKNEQIKLSYFDEAQNAANSENPHHSEQRGADGEVGEDVLKEYAHNGGKDQNKVKEVPGNCEVVMPKSYDLHDGFCKDRVWVKICLKRLR